jgi:hypothetical protein
MSMSKMLTRITRAAHWRLLKFLGGVHVPDLPPRSLCLECLEAQEERWSL